MPWVDLSQAAFTLGVSERTIRNWIKSGKLRARSVEGRREVEIPDPEDEEATRVFTDVVVAEETGRGVQKRLEVALLECGRVKGTLASQERIMENLSANIAELNAKLQTKETSIWRRTLLAALLAFLGVVAYLTANWSGQHQLSVERGRMKDQYITDMKQMQTDYDEKLATYAREKADALATADTRRVEELDALEKELRDRFQEDLKARMDDLRRLLDRMTEENKELRTENETLRAARTKAETEVTLIRHDLEKAARDLAEAERETEILKTRVEELEKIKRELEDTERSLRRRLMGDTADESD